MSEVIVAKPVLLVATILAESVPSLQEKYVRCALRPGTA